MHPKSIQRFDMLILGSIAIYAVSFFLGYDDTIALTRAAYAKAGANIDPTMVIVIGFVVVMAYSLLMWWLVSSKRSNVGRWIMTVFFALALIALVYSFATGAAGKLSIATGLSLLSEVLWGVGIFFTFQPDAKAWLEPEQQ
jgi:hypothetical protein